MTGPVQKGQKWVRKATGETVEVTAVGMPWDARRHVVVQGKRRVYAEMSGFLKKYGRVDDTPTKA